MTSSTITSQIETITISVPQFIADLDQAEQDIKEGRGKVLENANDIDALFRQSSMN